MYFCNKMTYISKVQSRCVYIYITTLEGVHLVNFVLYSWSFTKNEPLQDTLKFLRKHFWYLQDFQSNYLWKYIWIKTVWKTGKCIFINNLSTCTKLVYCLLTNPFKICIFTSNSCCFNSIFLSKLIWTTALFWFMNIHEIIMAKWHRSYQYNWY